MLSFSSVVVAKIFALRIHGPHHRKPQQDVAQRPKDCGSLALVHTSLTELQHRRLGGASMKGIGWGGEWLQEPENQEVCGENMLLRNGFLNQDPKNDSINRHANTEGGNTS